MTTPAKPGNPFEVVYCPQCRLPLPPGQEQCPQCADVAPGAAPYPTEPPALQPLDPQPVRRWHPLDIILLASLLLYALLDFSNWPTYLRFYALWSMVKSLAMLASYVLVASDVWQDENSFGNYAYIITFWNLFWTVIGLIASRDEPMSWWLHREAFINLVLGLTILIGLWRRYGSPVT